MKRRVLSLLLVCLMLLSVVPYAVLADDAGVADEPVTDEPAYECPGPGNTHTLANATDPKQYGDPVEAECGEWGYTVYQCSECGEYFADDFVKPQEHDWKTVEEETPATCTEKGKTAKKECSNCGAIEGGKEIAALGHDFSVKLGEEGDCEYGVIHWACSKCDETWDEELLDGLHAWDEQPTEVVKEPTCGDEGYAIYTCTICETTKKVTIMPTGIHNLVEHKAVGATCTGSGTIAYWECKDCGKYFVDADASDEVAKDKSGKYVITVEPLGHDVKEWKVTKEPNCTDKGVEEGVCDRCKKTITRDVDATGHEFDKEHPTHSVDATCTKWGYKVYVCTICGFAEAVQTEAPKGHTGWDDKTSTNKVETKVQCDHAGERTWDCGRCGEPQSEKLPAGTHTVVHKTVAANCQFKGFEYDVCTNVNCYLDAVETYTFEKVEYNVTVNGEAVRLIPNSFKTTTKDVDLNNHLILVEVLNAPTCEEEGNGVSYCPYHNVQEIVPIEATGHLHTNTREKVQTPEEICVNGVIVETYCEDCGKVLSEKVKTAPKGHQWKTETVPATCAEDGYTREYCTVCDTEKPDSRVVLKFEKTLEYYGDNKEAALEKAKADHPGLEDEESGHMVREGDCTLIDLYIYHCSICDTNVLIVVGTGDHVWEVKKAAKAATCEEAGNTALWECKTCGEVDPEHAGTVIPELGHDWKDVEGKPATCDAAGYTDYQKCARCNKEQGKETIAKINHANENIVDSREVSCEEFGYEHYVCPDCGREYIRNYEAAIGHDWEITTKATCTEDGEKTCKNDPEHKEVIPATGHHNKAGESIVDDCRDEVKDRVCVDCKKTIGKTHNAVATTDVEPGCFQNGYHLEVCENCGEYLVEEILPAYGEHLWGDWTPVEDKEPTFTESGLEERFCTRCEDGHETRECAPLEGFYYTIDVDNALNTIDVPGLEKPEGGYVGYVDSSLVAVTVSLESAGVDVWGMNFDLAYDESVVEFVGVKFVSEQFTHLPDAANAHDSVVSISLFAPNTGDKKSQNAKIEGKNAAVVVYFLINNPKATETSFTVSKAQAITNDPKADEVAWESKEAKIEIGKFMDVNGDTSVDLYDMLLMSELITAGGYDVALDLDKNGYVDYADMIMLNNYLIAAASYEDLVSTIDETVLNELIDMLDVVAAKYIPAE